MVAKSPSAFAVIHSGRLVGSGVSGLTRHAVAVLIDEAMFDKDEEIAKLRAKVEEAERALEAIATGLYEWPVDSARVTRAYEVAEDALEKLRNPVKK